MTNPKRIGDTTKTIMLVWSHGFNEKPELTHIIVGDNTQDCKRKLAEYYKVKDSVYKTMEVGEIFNYIMANFNSYTII